MFEGDKRLELNGRVVRTGDFLSIDGRNGSVYLGAHPVEDIRFMTE